jgi:hypothetical protein
MTGYMAEKLGRRWIAFDRSTDYVRGSAGRFLSDKDTSPNVMRGQALVSAQLPMIGALRRSGERAENVYA